MDSRYANLIADQALKIAALEKERDELKTNRDELKKERDTLKEENEQLKTGNASSPLLVEVESAGEVERGEEEESWKEAVVHPCCALKLSSQDVEPYHAVAFASANAVKAAMFAWYTATGAKAIVHIAANNPTRLAVALAKLAQCVDMTTCAAASASVGAGRASIGPTVVAVAAAIAAIAGSAAASAATKVGRAVAEGNKKKIFLSTPVRATIAAAFTHAATQFNTAAGVAAMFDEAFASSGIAIPDGAAIPTAPHLREAKKVLKRYSKADSLYVAPA